MEILANDLNRLNAGSVLLGAARTPSERGVTIDIRSQQTLIERGATVEIPELLVAETTGVTVARGARLSAQEPAPKQGSNTLELPADGALARVSAGNQVRVIRAPAEPKVPSRSNRARGLMQGGRSPWTAP